MILRRKREEAEAGRGPDSIRFVAVPIFESPAGPLEFGRFLLSSAGLHLLLFWAFMTVGFHNAPPPERPLQVRLVEVEAPEPLPTKPASLEARARQQVTPLPPSAPAGPKEVASRDPIRPSIGPAEVIASRTSGLIDNSDPDERRRTASRLSAEELAKDLGLPAGNTRFPGPSIGGDAGAADGVRPKAIGGGVVMALPSSRLYAGPAVLGGTGGGDGGGGPGNRGRARRLGAELTATLAPTVTVGPRQGAAGRGGQRGGALTGERFSGPDYGANPPPQYPPLAREKGYEGTVYLRVQVQGDGRVGALAVERSSGYEVLDRAASDSVKEWTFLPAQKDGRPATSWVLLPVKFMLK